MKVDTDYELGERIVYLIVKSGKRDDEIAKRLSCTKSRLRLIKDGLALPNSEEIKRMCSLFNVTADELLFGGKGWKQE